MHGPASSPDRCDSAQRHDGSGKHAGGRAGGDARSRFDLVRRNLRRRRRTDDIEVGSVFKREATHGPNPVRPLAHLPLYRVQMFHRLLLHHRVLDTLLVELSEVLVALEGAWSDCWKPIRSHLLFLDHEMVLVLTILAAVIRVWTVAVFTDLVFAELSGERRLRGVAGYSRNGNPRLGKRSRGEGVRRPYGGHLMEDRPADEIAAFVTIQFLIDHIPRYLGVTPPYCSVIFADTFRWAMHLTLGALLPAVSPAPCVIRTTATPTPLALYTRTTPAPSSSRMAPLRMALLDDAQSAWEDITQPFDDEGFVPPGWVRASHILFLADDANAHANADAKAAALATRIDAEEMSFGEAALRFSACPSRDLNGRLGTFESLSRSHALPVLSIFAHPIVFGIFLIAIFVFQFYEQAWGRHAQGWGHAL